LRPSADVAEGDGREDSNHRPPTSRSQWKQAVPPVIDCACVSTGTAQAWILDDKAQGLVELASPLVTLKARPSAADVART